MNWRGSPGKSYQGVLEDRVYNTSSYGVCRIVIDASLYITKDVNVQLTGKNALVLASNKGNIDLHSDLIVGNSNGPSLGGFSVSNKGTNNNNYYIIVTINSNRNSSK